MASRGGSLSFAAPAFSLDGKGLYYAEGAAVRFRGFDKDAAVTVFEEPQSFDFTSLATSQIDPTLVAPLLNGVEIWSDLLHLVTTQSEKIKRCVWSLIFGLSCQGYKHAEAGQQIQVALHPMDSQNFAPQQIGIIKLIAEGPPPAKKAKTVTIEPFSEEDRFIFVRGNCRGLICVGVFRQKQSVTEIIRIDACDVAKHLGKNKSVCLTDLKIEGKSVSVPGVVLYAALSTKAIAVVAQTLATGKVADLKTSATRSKHNQSLHLFDLVTETVDAVVLPSQTEIITGLAIDMAGKVVSMAIENGTLYWLHRRKRKASETAGLGLEFRQGAWHDHAVTSMAFSPNGDATYSADEKGLLAVWSGENNLNRSVMTQLGAPIIGEMGVPCPNMIKCLGKQLDKIRALVCVCLASNELKVIDTASFTVKLHIPGVQTVVIPPERAARRWRELILMTSRPTVHNQSYYLGVPDPSEMCVLASPVFVDDAYGDHQIDLGRLDALTEDGLPSPGVNLRTHLQWSRQKESQWLPRWRSRLIAMTSKLTALAISETQRHKHQQNDSALTFYVPKDGKALEKVSVFLQEFTITCLEPMAQGQVGFISGTDQGLVTMWMYDPALNTFCVTFRENLGLGQEISLIRVVDETQLVVVIGKQTVQVYGWSPTSMTLEATYAVLKRGPPKPLRMGSKYSVTEDVKDVALDEKFVYVATAKTVEVFSREESFPLRSRVFKDFSISQLFIVTKGLILVGEKDSEACIVTLSSTTLENVRATKPARNFRSKNACVVGESKLFLIDPYTARYITHSLSS